MTALILSLLLGSIEYSYITYEVFLTYWRGPAQNFSDCCTGAVDYDGDNAVTLRDFAAFQNLYRCVNLHNTIQVTELTSKAVTNRTVPLQLCGHITVEQGP